MLILIILSSLISFFKLFSSLFNLWNVNKNMQLLLSQIPTNPWWYLQIVRFVRTTVQISCIRD